MTDYENGSIKEIAEWVEKIRFRKRYFGGVKEQDVWKKISELNEMYEQALKAERLRYDALIEYYRNTGKEEHEQGIVYDE